MKADEGIRILTQLLEVKIELQRMCLAEIKGIDRALEIIKKEIREDDRKNL